MAPSTECGVSPPRTADFPSFSYTPIFTAEMSVICDVSDEVESAEDESAIAEVPEEIELLASELFFPGKGFAQEVIAAAIAAAVEMITAIQRAFFHRRRYVDLLPDNSK